MSPDLHSVTGEKSTAPPSSAETQTVVIAGDSFVDDTFDFEHCDSYHLSIEISRWSVSFCVLDTLSNKYIVLHREAVKDNNDLTGLSHLLGLIQTQEFLRPKYKSTSLVLVHDHFTLIPAPLYTKGGNAAFLSFNIEGLSDGQGSIEILEDKLNGTEAYNLYPVTKSDIADLKSALGDLRIIHHTTSLIGTLLNLSKNQNEKTCFLHIQEGIFSFLVIEGNDLRYCNNFPYNCKEDLAYYTLFVCEQLQLNPETLNMVLLGEIAKESPEYEILYTYIRNLSFINRQPDFSYSYKLDALPGHYHFNLFSQYHCVL